MQPSGFHLPARGRVILRDAATGRWLRFERPRRIITAKRLADVTAALERVEEAVGTQGLYAAGFVSYEAAPAFDASLVVQGDDAFPLLWFGLYDRPATLSASAGAPASSRLTPPVTPKELGASNVLTRLKAGAPEWRASVKRAAFNRALSRIKTLIRRGETYQVNYTYRLRARFSNDPWDFFLQLVAAQDPPYGAYVDAGEWVICSASPELFFRLNGSRIECRPMKGTAARGETRAEDRARARALQASEKERAENVMIVDMVRHDLGRVAQTGSVKVARLCEVERYPTIWQMTSTVRARTQAPVAEIFQALFPAASVTGAPKVRTTHIIAGLERLPRRIYTGAIGFLAPGRHAQFSVAIRTLLVNRLSASAEYGVGSGITWDSDPGAEWLECQAKSEILYLASSAGSRERLARKRIHRPTPIPQEQDFRLLETLRWTPTEGYYLLERHLRRLQTSARYFDFSLDTATLRRRLRRLAATFGKKGRRIRVLVEPLGRITIEAKALPMADITAARQSVAVGRTERQRRSAEAPLRGGLVRRGGWELAFGVPGRRARPQRVVVAATPVDCSNPLLYHKTTNRAVYEAARAARPGFDDVLLFNERGEVTESTIANVAVEIGGKLCTPPVSCGVLPGTFRAELLERGILIERRITVTDLRRARRIFLLNSVRGMYPVVFRATPPAGD